MTNVINQAVAETATHVATNSVTWPEAFMWVGIALACALAVWALARYA